MKWCWSWWHCQCLSLTSWVRRKVGRKCELQPTLVNCWTRIRQQLDNVMQRFGKLTVLRYSKTISDINSCDISRPPRTEWTTWKLQPVWRWSWIRTRQRLAYPTLLGLYTRWVVKENIRILDVFPLAFQIYVETVMKNALIDTSTQINSELFANRVDQIVCGHPSYI